MGPSDLTLLYHAHNRVYPSALDSLLLAPLSKNIIQSMYSTLKYTSYIDYFCTSECHSFFTNVPWKVPQCGDYQAQSPEDLV